MTTTPDIEFAPLDAISLDTQVELLGNCFEKPVDKDWYRWKHVEGPWGPSGGLVGFDAQGPASLFLVLPWQTRNGDVHTLGRGVDCGTLARAQRKGVFQAMGARWIDDQRSQGQPFTFCTANDAAASVHVRNGATVMMFPHAYSTPFLSSLGLRRHKAVTVDEAIAEYKPVEPHPTGIIATNWTAESLAWRFDSRAGLTYKAALLRGSTETAGLVYRIASKSGIRVLVRTLSWGDPRAQEGLTASVARSQLAPIILDLERRLGRMSRARGRTPLCAWALSAVSGLKPLEPGGWNPTLADVEGVM